MVNVELGSGSFQHCCRNCVAINYTQRLQSGGSPSLFSEAVTGYAAVTPPDGEFPWRAVRLFLLLEKYCFEEKTMMPGGGGWRDSVSGFVYTPGMTFGQGYTHSSWAAFNGEDYSLISWVSFPGLGTRSPSVTGCA